MIGDCRVVAVILAAGRSSRMGFPKALLRCEESTFLQAIMAIYQTVGLEVYAVLGEDSSRITSEVDLSSVTMLVNEDPSRGPLSSLQVALPHISFSEAFILHPVDHPLVASATVRQLLQTHQYLAHCILIPEYLGTRGHPVLFPAKYYPELRRAPLSEGARWVVRAHRSANHFVEVPDPAILLNVDTEEQYQSLFKYPRLNCPPLPVFGTPGTETRENSDP